MTAEARQRNRTSVQLDLQGSVRLAGRTGNTVVARLAPTRTNNGGAARLVLIDVEDGAHDVVPAAGPLLSVCQDYSVSAGGKRLAVHNPDGSLRGATEFGDHRQVIWVVATPGAIWVLSTRGFDRADVGLNGDLPAVLHDLDVTCIDPADCALTHHFEIDRPDVTVLDPNQGAAGCRLQRVYDQTSSGVVLIQAHDRSDGQANQRVLYFAPDADHYRLLGQTRPRVRGRSGLYQVVFAEEHLLTAGYRDLAARDLEWERDGIHQRPFTYWPSARTLRRLRRPGAWLETRHPLFIAAADNRTGTECLRFDPKNGSTSSLGTFAGAISPVGIPVPGTDRTSFIRPVSFDDDNGVWLSLTGDQDSQVVGFDPMGRSLGQLSVPYRSVGVGMADDHLVTIRNDGRGPLEINWHEL